MRRPLVLALLLPLTGCGSSASTPSDPTVPFVGTWTVTTGTLTAACPAPLGNQMQKLDMGQQTITKATDGSLSLTILPGCNIILDVAGNAANLRMTMPPQTCALSFMGVPVMGTFTGGNFTVNGQSATFSYTGNATLGAIVCPVTGTGMSTKGSPADGGAPTDSGSSAQSEVGPSDGP
jgi:hypothetical protein